MNGLPEASSSPILSFPFPPNPDPNSAKGIWASRFGPLSACLVDNHGEPPKPASARLTSFSPPTSGMEWIAFPRFQSLCWPFPEIGSSRHRPGSVLSHAFCGERRIRRMCGPTTRRTTHGATPRQLGALLRGRRRRRPLARRRRGSTAPKQTKSCLDPAGWLLVLRAFRGLRCCVTHAQPFSEGSPVLLASKAKTVHGVPHFEMNWFT